MNKFKYAFSMVEMMILLLIASLIVAASVPLITKKHLRLPTTAVHGSYACYYQDGHLMEIKTSGKTEPKVLAGYPREVAKCIFEPPQKATFFQISAIGGGGGGGDAGFTGSNPTTIDNEGNQLFPFGSKDDDGNYNGLKKEDLLKIGVDDTDDAIQEVESLMGKLWGFAQGANSGKHGLLYYTQITTGTKLNECPSGQIHYSPKEHKQTVETEATMCKGADNESVANADIYVCYKKKKVEVENESDSDFGSEGKYYAYQKDGDTIGGYAKFVIPFSNLICKKEEPIYKTETKTKSCQKTRLKGYTEPEYYESYVAGKDCTQIEGGTSGNCWGLTQTNCHLGSRLMLVNCTDIIKPCSPGITGCLKKDKQPIYETYTGTCEYDVKVDTGEVWENKWLDKTPAEVKWGDCEKEDCKSSDYICDKVEYSSDMPTVSYYVDEPDGCNLTNEQRTTNTYAYQVKKHDKSYAIGLGKFCTTPAISGKLGLAYKADKNFASIEAPVGPYVNVDYSGNPMSANPPNSFCPSNAVEVYDFSDGKYTSTNGIGSCGPSVGPDYKGTYAQTKIGTNTITSYSATKGSTSDKLTQKTKIINNVLDEITKTAIVTKNVTLYYDDIVSSGSKGTDGTCSPSDGGKYNCRPDSDTLVGYCLQHHGQSESSAEYNGYYYYNDTHDVNSLWQGLSGESGEYKTTVVRSLEGLDLTISVGRGGSAAAMSLGQSGADGSATTFGTILRAEGGKGGQGNLLAIKDEELPKYDKDTMNFKKLQACFTNSTYDNDEECKAWRNNPSDITFYRNTSGELGSTPTKTTTGGMFSFILGALASSNDNIVQALMNNAGRGGNGGGVEHYCWAGQKILKFEGQDLKKSSVYRQEDAPSGVPENHKIPADCQKAYKNIPAGTGYDGAVIITW